jgi:prepilin-type N-terminal cleavage/methylation domain-containing protein
MNAPRANSRRGMTLLELMIVVMILGLLAVVVLPAISTSIESRRFREASRNVSSFIARSQVRALDAPHPRGLMIQPLAANPLAAIDLFFASTPSPYCGESMSANVTIQSPGTSTNIASLALQFDLLSDARIRGQLRFVRPGDAIRFGTGGPEYCFVPDKGTGPHAVRMWLEDSQAAGNTPWPRGEKVPFRIRRQPHRSSSGIMQLQRGAAIDIPWSCIGTRPLYDPSVPPSDRVIKDITQPVTLLFDRSGKPDQLVHSGGVRTIVGAPLFLLIGSAELAGNGYLPGVAGEVPNDADAGPLGANWQYNNSVWLAVDNGTGAVKFGPVASQATNVVASQRFVRLTIALGAGER